MHWVLYDKHFISTQIRPDYYIHTLERSFCLISYIIIVIRHIPRCVIRYLRHSGLYHMNFHWVKLSRLNTSIISHRVGRATRGFQAAPPNASRSYSSRNVMATRSRHIPRWFRMPHWHHGLRGNLIYIECHMSTRHSSIMFTNVFGSHDVFILNYFWLIL